MSIDTVLFDLDGTLLPMDQDVFVDGYFKLLAKKMAAFGYEGQKLLGTVWGGVSAMVKNDGRQTNKAAFWNYFAQVYGEERARADEPLFDEFYAVEFQQAQAFCGYDPQAAETVHAIREMGCRVALATNPLFPPVATQSRIRWAGLQPEEFELVTTYDNSHYCKPNPAYFAEVAELLGAASERCLMVGNDAGEDMVAESLGMKVFLLTDCLINSAGTDINAWPHGGFPQLLDYLRKIR